MSKKSYIKKLQQTILFENLQLQQLLGFCENIPIELKIQVYKTYKPAIDAFIAKIKQLEAELAELKKELK